MSFYSLWLSRLLTNHSQLPHQSTSFVKPSLTLYSTQDSSIKSHKHTKIHSNPTGRLLAYHTKARGFYPKLRTLIRLCSSAAEWAATGGAKKKGGGGGREVRLPLNIYATHFKFRKSCHCWSECIFWNVHQISHPSIKATLWKVNVMQMFNCSDECKENSFLSISCWDDKPRICCGKDTSEVIFNYSHVGRMLSIGEYEHVPSTLR